MIQFDLLQHDYPDWEGGVNKMYHGIRGMEDRERVHLHMEKGDTVFFHPLLVHGSGNPRQFKKSVFLNSEMHTVGKEGVVQ